jgi:hypothetical protein
MVFLKEYQNHEERSDHYHFFLSFSFFLSQENMERGIVERKKSS